MSSRPTVAFVTLGCARNEVDSEELAGRLAADGWDVVDEPDSADAVLVNTCGFVAAAKKDSVDTILADADLGFDSYTDISAQLRAVVAGEDVASHTPRDRRSLLPISPVDRAGSKVAVPGHRSAAELSANPERGASVLADN